MISPLSKIVIAGLYKESLVLVQEENISTVVTGQQFTNKKEKTEKPAPPPAKKWFLGNNKEHITIIVKDNSAVFINDEWLGTLGRLLAACKLNTGDVAIVNFQNYPLNFNALKEQLTPQYILMFDVSMQDMQLPFAIPQYQVQQYAECTFMIASSVTLSDSNTDAIKAEKRKLWEKLKVIFKI
ncbi:MAG: hypothetical protein ABI921_15010 [Panacibacter sp.]